MTDFSALFRTTDEEKIPLDAEIEGEIPSWLNGTLVRIGPGVFDLKENFVMNHWFDGYGVLINFKISDGKVQFLKKYIQSDAYAKASSLGKPAYTEFGTKAWPDPSKGFFSRIKSAIIPELTDSDAINIFQLEDSIYAASETNYVRRIDPYTLETREKVDLGKLLGATWLSSHQFRDDNQISWTVGSSISASGLHYNIIKIPPANDGRAETALKNAKTIASISPTWKTGVSYYHSFGMTKNYVIFIEQPMIMNTMKIMSATFKQKSLRECMEWHPEGLNRFIVVEKSTGKVYPIKIRSNSSFFSLHCINSYEKEKHIILDVMTHDSPEIVDNLFLDNLRKSQFDINDSSISRRYVIPLIDSVDSLPVKENLIKIKTTATATITDDYLHLTPEIIIPGKGYDFPSINPNLIGKPYRYFYASGMYNPGPSRNTLMKVDIETKEVKTWKMNDYSYPAEAFFISNPDSKDEDDGILLSTVTDVREDHLDFLLILNAKTMEEIARAYIDAHIPNLIHSIFLPEGVNVKQ